MATPFRCLDYSQNGKEKSRWDDSKARTQLLRRLVSDGRAILDVLKGAELTADEKAAMELLSRVTEQDIVTYGYKGTVPLYPDALKRVDL